MFMKVSSLWFCRLANPRVIALAIPILALLIWKYYFHTTSTTSTVPEPKTADRPLLPALPSPDPRLSYTGPFKNIHPDIPYVSEETCAKCHAKHAKTYCLHPMARTLKPIAQVESPPLGSDFHNPFESLNQLFKVSIRDGRVFHMRSAPNDDGKLIFQQDLEVQFAIGSGTHAHSYLLIKESEVLQTPVTWYSQKKRWDLSPGFKHNILSGRRVALDCLFCHSNGANR